MIKQNTSPLQINICNETCHNMMLRDLILKFITLHSQGVNMHMLETEFHETRMHLGFVLQKLDSDGLILKFGHQYYPLTTA